MIELAPCLYQKYLDAIIGRRSSERIFFFALSVGRYQVLLVCGRFQIKEMESYRADMLHRNQYVWWLRVQPAPTHGRSR